jgi:hypothetical protein
MIDVFDDLAMVFIDFRNEAGSMRIISHLTAERCFYCLPFLTHNPFEFVRRSISKWFPIADHFSFLRMKSRGR